MQMGITRKQNQANDAAATFSCQNSNQTSDNTNSCPPNLVPNLPWFTALLECNVVLLLPMPLLLYTSLALLRRFRRG